MRRRLKKRYLSFKLIIIVISFISVVGVGYSYLSGVLKITGQVSGEVNNNYVILPGSNPNLEAKILLTNAWQEGGNYKYQYRFDIKNVGTTTIDIFTMTVNFLNSIESASIPNFDHKISGKTLTITNVNYSIAPNQTLTINFILTSKSSSQIIKSIKFDVPTGDEVTLDQFNVQFSITNGWGQYTYQYNVTLTNKTGVKVNAWQLDVTLPTGTTFVSGWNAIYSFNNQILTIKSENYNAKINNGSSVTIGLQLTTNIINFIPTNIRVSVR